MLQSKKSYRVNICEWREKRSLSQNALYWLWLTEIHKQNPLITNANLSGPELWHEVFKNYFCPSREILNNRGRIEVKSTKALDTGEMHFYLNRIDQWCMDRNIMITIPDNCEYRELQEQQNK